MEDALGPFRRGIEEDNQFFDMDTDDPFKAFGQHMEDEEGSYEGKEEAFVEVMSADEEGEDDDELLDEDELDGEDLDDETASRMNTAVASKTPVRRRLKRKAALKKAPGAPKRFKSPYILFSIERRESIKRQLPPQAKVTEIMSKIAETWRNLTPEERKHWQDKAERDRQRYDSEMSSYEGPLKVPRVRPRRNPEQPKRATSAFMQFSRSVKPQVRMEHLGMSNAEITKMLTEKWKGASKEEKLPFLEKEREDRAVYKKAMEKWQEDAGRKANAAEAAAAAAATAGEGGIRGMDGAILMSAGWQEGLDEMELGVSEEGIATTAIAASRRTGLKTVSSVPPPPPPSAAPEAEAASVMNSLYSPPLLPMTQACVPPPPPPPTVSLPHQEQQQHQDQHQHHCQQQQQPQALRVSSPPFHQPYPQQQQQQHQHQQEARQQQERQQQQQQHLLQQQQLHQQQQREKREQQRVQQQEREEQAAQYRDDSLLMEYLSAAQESFKLYDNFTRGIQAESAAATALSAHKMEDDSCYASSSCSSAYHGMLHPISVPAGRKAPVPSRASSVSTPSLDAGITTADKDREASDHVQHRQGVMPKRENFSKISPWLIPMLSRSPVGSPLHSSGEFSVSSTSSLADSHHSGANGGGGDGSESEGVDGQKRKLGAGQEMLGRDRPHHSSKCVAAAAASSDSGGSSYGDAGRGGCDRELIQNTDGPTNYYFATPVYNQQLNYHHQKQQQQQQQQQQQPHQQQAFSLEEQNLLGLPPSTPSSPPYLNSPFLPAPPGTISVSRQTVPLPADGKNNCDLSSSSSSCSPLHPQHPPLIVVTTTAPGGGVSQTTYQPLMTEWPPTASSLAVARGAVVDPAAGKRGTGAIPSSHGVHGMGNGTEVKFGEVMIKPEIAAVEMSMQQQHGEGIKQQMALAHDHEQDITSDSHSHV